MIELDTIHHTDLLTLCGMCEPQSIDMILCDLPYGTTACSWDEIIPFEPMWAAFKRVIKPRGAIVLTASQPFTSKLVMSNVNTYRHRWAWDKDNSAGFALANIRPFDVIEDVLVFGLNAVNYYPILETRGNPRLKGGYSASDVYGLVPSKSKSNTYYPKNLIRFGNAVQIGKTHPTQKPVALFEYLIRTYTREGELVLDPCVGSGTTAYAARSVNRHWICGDKKLKYVEIARKRMAEPYNPRLFDLDVAPVSYDKTDKVRPNSQLSLPLDGYQNPERAYGARAMGRRVGVEVE